VNWFWKIVFPIAVVCAFSVICVNAFAQGCASCYTTASAGGPQTARALRSGILLLLFPPTLIFAGIVITLRRWKTGDGALPRLSARGPEFKRSKNDERTK